MMLPCAKRLSRKNFCLQETFPFTIASLTKTPFTKDLPIKTESLILKPVWNHFETSVKP